MFKIKIIYITNFFFIYVSQFILYLYDRKKIIVFLLLYNLS